MISRIGVLILSVVLAILAGMIAALAFQPVRVQPPAITWVSTDYSGAPVCPGDTVKYRLVLLVEGTDVAPYVFPVYMRANDHPTVVEYRNSDEGQALMAQYNAPIVGDTAIGARVGNIFLSSIAHSVVVDAANDMAMPVSRERALLYDPDTSFVIPDLEPGPYNRILTAGLFGLPVASSVRLQPLIVRDDCEVEND